MSTKEEIEKNVGENTLTSSGEIRTIKTCGMRQSNILLPVNMIQMQ